MYAEAVRQSVQPNFDINAIIAQAVAAPKPAPAAAPPRFDASQLYDKGGPVDADIKQDALGDCYFVATLGAVARANPGAIQNAISFDAKTGNFAVALHDGSGKAVTVQVTQAELAYNLQRSGGSTADNTGKDARIWPAVMETAFAKMNDSNHADGLKEGFDKIAGGGYIENAMQTITGSKGTNLSYSKGMFEGQDAALDRLGKSVDAAIGNNRPVTLATQPENRSMLEWLQGAPGTQDGLVDSHAFMVQSVTKDAKGEWQVTVRNPWGTNNGVGEGRDTPSAVITVPLRTIVDTGGLQYFNAGAAR